MCLASARMPVPAATSQVRRKACLADPRGIRARTSKGVRVRGPGCRRCDPISIGQHPATPIQRTAMPDGTCFFAVTTNASKRSSRRTPRPHGRREDPQPQGWTASDEEAGAERSEARHTISVVGTSGGLRARSSAGRDAGAPRARRIHRGSDPAVEGPRRGPKPREGRPDGRWKRRSPVRTHLRSNASKVMPHVVPMRASMPVTAATSRSRLRGKRTPRRQRSWRHDAAAGGGNSPKGMKRAVRTRRSRDRLHQDLQQ